METNKFQGRQALKLLFVAGLSLLLLIPAVYVVNRWLPWTLGKWKGGEIEKLKY